MHGGAGGDDALADGDEEAQVRGHALVIGFIDRHSQHIFEASELLSECLNEHDDQLMVLRSNGRKSNASRGAKA